MQEGALGWTKGGMAKVGGTVRIDDQVYANFSISCVASHSNFKTDEPRHAPLPLENFHSGMMWQVPEPLRGTCTDWRVFIRK